MCGDVLLPALGRARVVGLARRDRGEQRPHRREQLLAPVPAGVLDEHADGVAVEPGVVDELADDVGGVEAEVPRSPWPRHDDHGAHVAELARDPLGEDRAPLRLAPRPLISRPENDRVMRAVRAGDVDLVHVGVPAQIGALGRAPVGDAEEPPRDQRAEPLLDQRAEIGVDGVHLEDDNLLLDEQLVERVHRPDRGHVAGAEHE